MNDDLIGYTKNVGRLAARAGRTLVSGGAKGIDLAAMNGALEAGGSACGVVASGLSKMVTHREHRDLLLEGRLTLVSPYDPAAGFNVGHAMQRNKLIYALADAALIVNSDEGKGGTWTGAVEQLEKLRFAPLYVRSTGEPMPGLRALANKGAYPWPDPDDAPSLDKVFDAEPPSPDSSSQLDLTLTGHDASRPTDIVSDRSGSHTVASELVNTDDEYEQPSTTDASAGTPEADESVSASGCETPANRLFSAVRSVIPDILQTPKGEVEVGAALGVSPKQAGEWLRRLRDEGALERQERPVRYRLKAE